jgi:hypothetical protein
VEAGEERGNQNRRSARTGTARDLKIGVDVRAQWVDCGEMPMGECGQWECTWN